MKTFNEFINESDFRPGFVTSPAPWGTVEDARKFIINVLLQRPDLTIDKFVELNKNGLRNKNKYYKNSFHY